MDSDDKESEMYNDFAPQYDAIEELPQSTMYQQLVEHALGSDCKGLKVLDLGGGTGLHARKAIDRGAAFVDIVDISPGMIKHGQAAEAKSGRDHGRLRWFLGDISRPLEVDTESLPLVEASYDIVMLNWTFEHADNDAELRAMWSNASRFCKTGAKFISVKMANPWARTDGKYGVTLSNQERFPGGVRYTYTNHTDPEFAAIGTTMEASWDFDQSKLLAEEYGFTEFRKVSEAEMECVKNDPEYWQMHVDDPMFICVVARKSG